MTSAERTAEIEALRRQRISGPQIARTLGMARSTVGLVLRRLGLGRLLRGTLDRYFYREYDPGDSFECDWLSGCFMMLRRQAFEEVFGTVKL